MNIVKKLAGPRACRGVLLAAALALAPLAQGQTTISADTTLAAGNSGVAFQNDVTLSVPDAATIGATDNISVSTTGGSTPQGTLLFQGNATVASRVGDAVDEYKAVDDIRVFKSAPNAGRLKLIRITSASAGASPTVTFTRPQGPECSGDGVTFNAANGVGVGGVGAQTLHFETDGEVVLEESKACYQTFYDISQVTTQMSGQGTLTFQNLTTSNFRGDIGTMDKSLKRLTISNRDNSNNKIVVVLGNIYADTIEVNTVRSDGQLRAPGQAASRGVNGYLTLGNETGGAPFGPPPTDAMSRPYTVSGNIVTARDSGGRLLIRDYPYHLKGQVGARDLGLSSVDIVNTTATLDGAVYVKEDANGRFGTVSLRGGARATFSGNIESRRVRVYEQSELLVNTPRLSISGQLYMNDLGFGGGAQSDGSTLALGANTLMVGGEVRFTQITQIPQESGGGSRKPHILSLTLDGAGSSGQLDASAGGVTLSSGLNQLDIQVDVLNPSSIANGQSFTLIKSNTSFSASLSKFNLIPPADSPLDFALSASGNDLVLTATRRRAAQNTLSVAADDRGDLALVPYYTVAGDWVTGLHIVNTSKRTQVVKVRLRRATDAMDALNFNVVLSPHDVYAGFLSDDEQGVIAWTSPDSSCTAPAVQNNRLVLPATYAAGAETGYIEVIAMGSPSNEGQPLARAARHADGSLSTAGAPLDCAAVRSNFFADGAGAGAATSRRGVQDRFTTWQAASPAESIKDGGLNTYVDSGNVLKVSYFIRDNATGIEFGDNAVHIRDFLANPALSNQQYGVFAGDLNGFDFPDLNGGVPLSSGSTGNDPIQRGRFNALRASAALGVGRIVNEWSANPANGVEMNWVVTLPGQYVMLKLPQYWAALASTSSATGGAGRPWVPTLSSADHQPLTNPACPRDPIAARAGAAAVAECDYRDLPVELTFTAYTREEGTETAAPASLVVSPAPPGSRPKTYLGKAVNVITFGQSRVFGGVDVDVSAPNLGQPYGWVSARVTSRDTDLQVCDWDLNDDISAGFGAAAGAALKDKLVCSAVSADSAVPVIGFAAWSRKVAANPDASYGRIVEHSYAQ